jgi:DNA-binding NtrC family response regulator
MVESLISRLWTPGRLWLEKQGISKAGSRRRRAARLYTQTGTAGMARNKVLLVEDERGVRFGIRNFLIGRDYDVIEAENLKDGEEAFRLQRPDIAILDYSLPDGNALDVLPRLKASDPSIPVIILTGHGSIDLAVRAIKEGAEQFLTKPVQMQTLLVIIERLLDNQRVRQRDQGALPPHPCRLARAPSTRSSATAILSAGFRLR